MDWVYAVQDKNCAGKIYIPSHIVKAFFPRDYNITRAREVAQASLPAKRESCDAPSLAASEFGIDIQKGVGYFAARKICFMNNEWQKNHVGGTAGLKKELIIFLPSIFLSFEISILIVKLLHA